MQVNDILKLEIIDLSHDGFGVAKADGFAIFVAGALIGEVVNAKITKINKGFGQAKLIEIIERSPNRVKPICNIFGICGGCDLMHLDCQSQLNFKKNMAENTFRRLGHLDIKVDEIMGMEEPYYYRNKIQVPFGKEKDKVIAGYYKKKSHDIIQFDKCYIQPEYMTDIIRFIKNLANEYKLETYDEVKKTGNLRHILLRSNYLDEVMVVIITHEKKIKKIDEIVSKITKRYPNVKSIIHNINSKGNNVILGDSYQLLYGEEVIIDRLNGIDFEIGHKSFFQINRIQTEKLYQRALEYLNPKKDDNVIDGYCGVGSISLFIAKHCNYVYGIESVEVAIENAKRNALINNIDNVEFIVGKVEDVISDLLNDNVSSIVFDPPRKGIEEVVLRKVMEIEIKKIVYVSCNVATLARDLSILSEKYDIKKTTLVDMFPQTSAVEAVTLLELKKK